MIQLVIAVALLGLLVAAWLPAERRRAFARRALLWGGGAALVLLLVTGRLHWIVGVLAGLWPLALRLLPLVRAWPWVRRWLGEAHADADPPPRSGNEEMSREEAGAMLGVPPDADEPTITRAHRRLMQRVHPDRGGSDYLASRLNAAKRRLLERR